MKERYHHRIQLSPETRFTQLGDRFRHPAANVQLTEEHAEKRQQQNR
jgi:hypothetical protein